MTGIVLQARMGSTRLPGKALLPLGGATLSAQVMRRLSALKADVRVLATDEASAARLGPIAEREGFELLVGPAEDVLARYCMAIRRFDLDLVIRATGDNPLVSAELAVLLVELRETQDPDYAGMIGMPVGMGVEVVLASVLLEAEAEASSPEEREHVCPFILGHADRFSVYRPRCPAEYRLPGARVTVDTMADYERILRIYGALYDGRPIPSPAVMEYLRAEGEGGTSP
jgi:spore coat polysaccharide biosynthesis protein SpsF